MQNKLIVISAINIFEGGPLSVLKDCLSELNKYHEIGFNILVFVHKKSLFQSTKFSKIKFIQIENSRGSYITRLYYEYFVFYNISKKIKPTYWLSFHDISPRLFNTVQFVYCHNPSPFNKLNIIDLYLQPKQFIFKLFYKYIYRINIHNNKYIIVQQKWIKEKFNKLYNLHLSKIIVSKPFINLPFQPINSTPSNTNFKYFIYPAFPRPFKNVEIICKCANMLNKYGYHNFKIFLTFDGTENNYAKYIFKRYKNNKNLIFTGSISRSEVFDLYSQADCLIFPSLLETWGMPISEFKEYKKVIIVSNLHYAKETIGSYEKVKFFNPHNYKELLNIFIRFLNDSLEYDTNKDIIYEEPFSNNWDDLFNIIFNK